MSNAASTECRWQDPPALQAEAVESVTEELATWSSVRTLGLHERPAALQLVARLLVQRGLEAPEEIRGFLEEGKSETDPPFSLSTSLHDPSLLADMEAAVERLVEARERESLVGVHGDYDADGVCAAALATRGLGELGFRVLPYVPHRSRDGYGVSTDAIARFAEEGAGLLLTCDTGVSAHREIDFAWNQHGLDTVVTDHHTPPEELPAATALINPHRSDCAYPWPSLSGTGVVLKLLQALARNLEVDEDELLRPHLDLVAVATVCDVVPLRDENRLLVQAGLHQLQHAPKTGLKALYQVADIGRRRQGEGIAYRVDEHTLGWTIGPRLNAVGRLEDAGEALDLLVSSDPFRAERLAGRLESCNGRRRSLTEAIERQAVERARSHLDRHGLALFGRDGDRPAWHPGVIGIVAGRLAERFSRPVFLFAFDEARGVWKGSGRLPDHLDEANLYEMLADCGAHLERFGGHQAAAGATLNASERAHLEAFARAFDEAARAQVSAEQLVATVVPDVEAGLEELDSELFALLNRLRPFGHSNERPRMLLSDVQVVRARRLGRDRRAGHLKLVIEDGPARREVIAFGLADRRPELLETPLPFAADLVVEWREDTYRGKTALKLFAEDVRVAEEDAGSEAEETDSSDAVDASEELPPLDLFSAAEVAV